jgi:hypothetical protein
LDGESETVLSCRPRPDTPWRGMCVSIAGDWGSSNTSLTISRGPCRALGLACSPNPRFTIMLLSHRLSPSGKMVDPKALLPASLVCNEDSTRRFHGARFPAPGSCRRSNAIEVRGLGGPCTPNPQARNFGDTPYPALCPGHALLLTFPPAGRLPSTISAADLWSALFKASQVVCSRSTPHLSRDGFASSASRRGPAPPWRFGRNEISQVPTRSLHT